MLPEVVAYRCPSAPQPRLSPEPRSTLRLRLIVRPRLTDARRLAVVPLIGQVRGAVAHVALGDLRQPVLPCLDAHPARVEWIGETQADRAIVAVHLLFEGDVGELHLRE